MHLSSSSRHRDSEYRSSRDSDRRHHDSSRRRDSDYKRSRHHDKYQSRSRSSSRRRGDRDRDRRSDKKRRSPSRIKGNTPDRDKASMTVTNEEREEGEISARNSPVPDKAEEAHINLEISEPMQDMELDIPSSSVEEDLAARRARRLAIMAKYSGIESAGDGATSGPAPPSGLNTPLQLRVWVYLLQALQAIMIMTIPRRLRLQIPAKTSA